MITQLPNGQFRTPYGDFPTRELAEKAIQSGGTLLADQIPEKINQSQGMPSQYIASGRGGNPANFGDPFAAGAMLNQKPAPTQPPQSPSEMGFMDRLKALSGNDIAGAVGSGMLALSSNPALQQMGQAGFERMDANRAKNKTIEALKAMGMPEGELKLLAENPALLKLAANEMYKAKYGKGNTPADQQSFEALISGFSEEDKKKARRIKAGLDARAGSQFNLTPEELAQRSFFTRGGTLSAESEVDSIRSAAQRDAGMRMFTYGLNNLEESLMGTTTGAFAGLLPALTGNQQLADQAVGMMAPLLKQTFRAAGEGVFTDKDQELLLAMIPDRGTNGQIIAQAIQNIRMLVELKLTSGGDISNIGERFGIKTAVKPPASNGGSDDDPAGIL